MALSVCMSAPRLTRRSILQGMVAYCDGDCRAPALSLGQERFADRQMGHAIGMEALHVREPDGA